MRKWLVAFFLLLITSISVFGVMGGNDISGVEVEQNLPSNTELVR